MIGFILSYLLLGGVLALSYNDMRRSEETLWLQEVAHFRNRPERSGSGFRHAMVFWKRAGWL